MSHARRAEISYLVARTTNTRGVVVHAAVPRFLSPMNFFIAGLAVGIFVGALAVIYLTPRPPNKFL